jgi:hypothetical protein
MMIGNRLDHAAVGNVAAAAKSRFDIWIRLISLARIEQMAEIGVWKGEFARTILRACPEIRTYYMIDPWRHLAHWNKPLNVDDRSFQAAYDDALRRTEFAAARRIVLRGATLEVIDSVADGSLDFAYIDGDHTLRGITVDLVAWYAKVKPGGYLGGDDLCRTIWQHSRQFEPTLVFPFARYFAEAVGAVLFSFPFDQFLICKPPNGRSEFAFVDCTGEYGDASLLSQLSLRARLTDAIRNNMPRPLAKVLTSKR